MNIISITIALAPILFFAIIIYKRDKYDKEPIGKIVKYYLLGITFSLIVFVTEKNMISVNIENGLFRKIYISFIAVALVEEFSKWAVLNVFLIKEQNFNERLDGVIYSIMLSLGFASTENIIYILSESKFLVYRLGLLRGITSIPAHIVFGIIMGYYISKSKFSESKIESLKNKLKSLLIPIVMHGVFDFILMIEERWSTILFIVYVVFVSIYSLKKIDEYTDNSRKKYLVRLRMNLMKRRKKD